MGALYIGVVLGMALWGIGSVQMYYYFNRYSNDHWRLKLIVVTAWALDTLHQALITHACYVYLITEYANVPYLLHLEPTLETFLVYRIWRLSHKNMLLVCVLEIIVIAEFIAVTCASHKNDPWIIRNNRFNFLCAAFFGRGIQFSSFLQVPSIGWISKLINSLMVASDFSVAGSLIFYLHRSRTGFRRSETIINRLIIFTINTGLVTSISAAMSLIFSSLYPTALIYVAFFICVSKLYVNSLFATLNSRSSMRDGWAEETGESQSISLSALRGNSHSRGIESGANKGMNVLSIKVDTETTHDDGRDASQRGFDTDAELTEYTNNDSKHTFSKSEV
ncbi:hypothetical protein M0805_000720 [Coniferiporia weirii]|nr:hypothetical protein M0805_000720 [Coniferiporia weirii]